MPVAAAQAANPALRREMARKRAPWHRMAIRLREDPLMDTAAFHAGLKADGFAEIETKRCEPGPANREHGHHFSVRGLILDGTFSIALGGVERTCLPGEVFEVEAGRLQFEAVGPEGVELAIGRKY
jgi:hypothetical protein